MRGRNWTSIELEAGCVVWSIRRLYRYLFSELFLIEMHHECLQQINKVGESKPRIQRWMEFFSAYSYCLSYRRGRENAKADFLSRLPLFSTAEDISGSSALTDPDDRGVYLIRTCSYTTPSCPIPGVGLGELAPSSYPLPGTGLNPSLSPVLGGLPLTKDDFRTHRAPMPLMHKTGPMTHPFADPTEEPCLSYAVDYKHEAPQFNWLRRTRSRTVILAGNTPLRPDF